MRQRRTVLLALVIAASAVVSAHAETGQNYGARLSILAADARYDEGLAVAEKFIQSVEPINGGKSALLAEALSWKAFLLSASGKVVEAGDYFERATEIYREVLPSDHPDLATALNNLGYHQYRLGHFDDALPLYRQALDIRERVLGPDDPKIADSLNNLAELFKTMERADEAVPLLNRVIEIRTRSLPPDDPLIAAAMQNLAGVFEVDPAGDKFIAAQKLLEKALAIREKSQRADHPDVVGVKNRIANNLFNQNRYAEAETKFLENLDLRRKISPSLHPDIAATLVGLGLTRYELGKFAEAEAALRESLDIRTKVLAPNSVNIAESYHWLGRILQKQKRYDAALENMRAAAQILLARGDRRHMCAEVLHSLQALLLEIAKQDPSREASLSGEAFEAAQNATFSETGAAVARMAARFATKDRVLQDLVRDREKIETELTALERQVTEELVLPPAKRNKTLRSRMSTRGSEMATIDLRLRRDFPDYFDLIKPAPLSVSDVQRLLRPDEALVAMVTSYDRTYVWCVTREGASWIDAAVTEDWLKDSVASLRRTLDMEDLRSNITAQSALFDTGLAYQLYAKLLAPLEASFNHKKHLIIVPSGALTSLPFHVLVTEEPKILHPIIGDLASYRDVSWLVRKHAIFTLPSINSLRALRKIGTAPAAHKALAGFGNPKLAKAVSQVPVSGNAPTQLAQAATRGTSPGVYDIAGVFNSLEELPGTEQELRTVAEELGAPDTDLHFGTDATESAVKQANLSDYRVIYFATHGLLAEDIKGLDEPALVFTPPAEPSPKDDGLLTATEISDSLRLDAEWVVLAACNTAGGDKPGAQSLTGLARAFFHAGARALLVSHWRVESEAAARLTTATFAWQAKDRSLSRAEALQQAMLAQIDRRGAKLADLWDAYPAFWAPFTLVGEGSRRN